MAIASRPGLAGGIVRTKGSCRMSGGSAVTVTFEGSFFCLSGGGCQPAPPQMVPAPGSTATIAVQFQGTNQLRTTDGTVYVRVQ